MTDEEHAALDDDCENREPSREAMERQERIDAYWTEATNAKSRHYRRFNDIIDTLHAIHYDYAEETGDDENCLRLLYEWCDRMLGK